MCVLGLDPTILFQPMSTLTLFRSIAGFQRKPITLTSREPCRFTKAFWGQVEVLGTSLSFHLPSSTETLSKSLHISEPQFLHL